MRIHCIKETDINFKCTEAEKEKIKAEAKKRGVTVSEYIRQSLRSANDVKTYTHLVSKLVILQNSLNEIEYLFDELSNNSMTKEEVQKAIDNLHRNEENLWDI